MCLYQRNYQSNLRLYLIFVFITIGKLFGLFSVGFTTVPTPSTKEIVHILNRIRIIGCPICHLSISKKSCTTLTHLNKTSFLLKPTFVSIEKVNNMLII